MPEEMSIVDSLILRELDHDGDIVLSEIARKVFEAASTESPAEFGAWLQVLALATITDRARRWNASRRQRIFRQQGAHAFRKAAESDTIEEYIASHGSVFDARLWINEAGEHVQRRLGDMTGHDLKASASYYQLSAEQDMLRANVLRAVAKKVGVRKVQDVYSEQQIRDVLGNSFAKALEAAA